MPSFAKKSMNFMRDVYALANEHANSGRPSNQSKPSYVQRPTGELSSQFAIPQRQYYNNQPSPCPQPVSSQGQGPAEHSQSVPGPYPQQIAQQPYNSWSPALQPAHFSAPLIHQSNPNPNAYNVYGSPHPQNFSPPSPISSPVSPQSHISPTGNGQSQYFASQKPPLPERPPSQHQPAWNGQSQGPLYSYSNISNPPPHGHLAFAPPTNTPSPAQQQGHGRINSNGQWPARPTPPPLPERSQPPNFSVDTSAPESTSNSHQQSHDVLPAVTVTQHSATTVYHEMPAEPMQYHATYSHSSTHNAIELPMPNQLSSSPQSQDQKTYTAELDGSPIAYLSPTPDHAAHSKLSLSTPGQPSSTQCTSSQVSDPHFQPDQGNSAQTLYHTRQGVRPGTMAYEPPGRQPPPTVSVQKPLEALHNAPHQSPYGQPSLSHQHYPSAPFVGQPDLTSSHHSPGRQYWTATIPSSGQNFQESNGLLPPTMESSFNMSSLTAAVDNVTDRQSDWTKPPPPATAAPHTQLTHPQVQLPMLEPKSGGGSVQPPHNFHNPQAWNNNNTSSHQYPIVSPQSTGAMSPPQMHQSAWASQPTGQIHSLSPTPQVTPQLPVQPSISHNFVHQSSSGPLPDTMRLQQNGDLPRVRKILSLDGGGVRGLSSLIILDCLMDMLGNMRGARLEPWQEFDMIAGTSTGGLIAIMLGRLHMSVSECIDAYEHLSREIFKPTHSAANVAGKTIDFLKAKGKFRSEPLEQCVKQMLKAHKLFEDELMVDRNPDSPATFVCAVEGLNSNAVVIRSYKSKKFDDLYGKCKIWEAARATSAASTFFEPINIGGRAYVDGALKHNNPIEKVDEESNQLWPGDQRLIISIGTGSAPGPDVTGYLKPLVEAMAKIVTESEDRSNAFREKHKDMIAANRLFRFNVFHGLADVGLAEHEAVGNIGAHTSAYLQRFDTARDVELCASSLKETGQRLGYIAGEELATYQEIQRVSTTTCEFCEECHQGIPYSDALFYCPECKMLICKNCQVIHDESHMRKLLRFRSMQWMPNLPGVPGSVSCWHCAKDTKVRWACEKCDLALCRRCAGKLARRDEFLKEHQAKQPEHRSFLAMYPPFWTTKPRWSQDKCSCVNVQLAPAVHCDRCHTVVVIGSRAFNCRDCMAEFGATQVLCIECYNQEDQTHLSKHQWMTTDFIYAEHGLDELEKDMKIAVDCPLCPGEKVYEGREHLHQHSNLQLLMTPLLVELFRLGNTQACQRDRIRRDRARATNPTTITCNSCCNFLCYEKKASICFTKKCLWAYCEDCTSGHRTHHRHPLYEVTISRAPAGAVNLLKCCICMTLNVAGLFKGLWCGECNNFDVCLQCAKKVEIGTTTLPEGLPHMKKILEQCKSRNWIWYA